MCKFTYMLFFKQIDRLKLDKETILIECSKLDCLLYISKHFHMGLKIFFNQKNKITTFPISFRCSLLKFPVCRKYDLLSKIYLSKCITLYLT